MRKIHKASLALLAGLAIAAVSTTASAQKTIKLTVMDGYPAKALWVKILTNYYVPEVNKRLAKTGNFKIDWHEAYGGQIVKPRGVMDGIKTKLGDMGIVTTVFHSSKLPLDHCYSVKWKCFCWRDMEKSVSVCNC